MITSAGLLRPSLKISSGMTSTNHSSHWGRTSALSRQTIFPDELPCSMHMPAHTPITYLKRFTLGGAAVTQMPHVHLLKYIQLDSRRSSSQATPTTARIEFVDSGETQAPDWHLA